MDEALLIEQFQKGNHKAFKALYDCYYKLLVVYAKQFVKDLQIAEDIAQDVFVTVYEKREKINIHTSFKAYLYTSVRHKAINYLKKETKYKDFDERLKALSDDAHTEVIDHVELAQKMYKAIEELPKKNQKIFRMSRFEGASNTHIANEMGLTKRTVETHISNALKRLREQLSSLSMILWVSLHFIYVFTIILYHTYK